MSYTTENTQITSDVKYEGEGLAISYKTGEISGRIYFSDFELLRMLLKLGYTSHVTETGNRGCIKSFVYLGHTRIEIGDYMSKNLDVKMAKNFVLHYLNNKSVKP